MSLKLDFGFRDQLHVEKEFGILHHSIKIVTSN